MRADWSRNEIEAVVDAYFWMLGEQIAGSDVSKKGVVKRLQLTALSARNPSAISRKFSNVSAILNELRAPWVQSYKPLSHVQRALRDHVLVVMKTRGFPL